MFIETSQLFFSLHKINFLSYTFNYFTCLTVTSPFNSLSTLQDGHIIYIYIYIYTYLCYITARTFTFISLIIRYIGFSTCLLLFCLLKIPVSNFFLPTLVPFFLWCIICSHFILSEIHCHNTYWKKCFCK